MNVPQSLLQNDPYSTINHINAFAKSLNGGHDLDLDGWMDLVGLFGRPGQGAKRSNAWQDIEQLKGWNASGVLANAFQSVMSTLMVFCPEDAAAAYPDYEDSGTQLAGLESYRVPKGWVQAPLSYPVMKLLVQPNDWEDEALFKCKIAQQIETHGVAYVLALPNQYGTVSQLHVVPNTAITPMAATSQFSEGSYRIGQLSHRAVWGDVDTPESYEQMLASLSNKYFSSKYVIPIGIPSLTHSDDFFNLTGAMADVLDTDSQMQKSRRHSLENNTEGGPKIKKAPGAVIHPEEWSQILDAYVQDNAGAANMRMPRRVPDGVEIEDSKFSPREMEFSQSSPLIRDDILGMRGIPPSMTGLGSHAAHSAVVAEVRAHGFFRSQPLMRIVAGQLTAGLRRFYPKSMQFQVIMQAAQMDDPQQKLSEMMLAVSSQSMKKGVLCELMNWPKFGDERDEETVGSPAQGQQGLEMVSGAGQTGKPGEPVTPGEQAPESGLDASAEDVEKSIGRHMDVGRRVQKNAATALNETLQKYEEGAIRRSVALHLLQDLSGVSEENAKGMLSEIDEERQQKETEQAELQKAAEAAEKQAFMKSTAGRQQAASEWFGRLFAKMAGDTEPRDGDGDGYVFDGTDQERPVGASAKAVVEKPRDTALEVDPLSDDITRSYYFTVDGRDYWGTAFEENGAWEIHFERDGSSELTNDSHGSVGKVFRRVIDMARDVVETQQPDVLLIKAPQDADGQRARVYERLAGRHAARMGYEIVSVEPGFDPDFGEMSVIALQRAESRVPRGKVRTLAKSMASGLTPAVRENLFAAETFYKSSKPEIRDADGDGLIYDGTKWERPVGDVKFNSVSDNPVKWKLKSESYNPDEADKVRQFGDFTMHYKVIKDGGDTLGEITVLDGDQVVGDLFFGENPELGIGLLEGAVEVHPDYRRQGIATAMYDWAESEVGMPFAPSKNHTPLAAAFWEDRNQRMVNADVPQTETPEFRAWFGDSVVVDSDGNPLVVYHGTVDEFSEFDRSKFARTDEGWFGEGFYFGESKGVDFYAGQAQGRNPMSGSVMPVYLSMSNPYIVRGDDGSFKEWNELYYDMTPSEGREWLQSNGYDGVVFEDAPAPSGWVDRQWVVFEPTQIKSAIGNRGTFGPSNPDIRKSYTPKASTQWKPVNRITLAERALDSLYDIPEVSRRRRRFDFVKSDTNPKDGDGDGYVFDGTDRERPVGSTKGNKPPKKPAQRSDRVKGYQAVKETLQGFLFGSEADRESILSKTADDPEELRKEQNAVFEDALNQLSPNMKDIAEKNIKEVTLYPSVFHLTDEVDARTGSKSPKGFATFGAFDAMRGELLLNGPPPGMGKAEQRGIMVHELAHTFDILEDGSVFSSRESWKKAWESEINTADAPLSKYATTDPSEGFAEFMRLVSEDIEVARSTFPESVSAVESVYGDL